MSRKVSCRDLEKALAGSNAALTAAFQAHATECAACSKELDEWRRISKAAPGLRRQWDSPDLLPRIRQAIAEQSARVDAESESAPSATPQIAIYRYRWLPAVSIAALFVLATTGLWIFRNTPGRDPLTAHWKTTKDPILTDRAIEEVETAEKAYLDSIENLSRLAEPRLAGATSAVLVNYREKLNVLDSAIAELRQSIDQNRGNTHLRRELLAVYQEKQRTLQDLMKEVKS